MNLGKVYIVAVPDEETEVWLMEILKLNVEHYPVILRDPEAEYLRSGQVEYTYPAKWIISKLGDAPFTLPLNMGDARGVLIRPAVQADAEYCGRIIRAGIVAAGGIQGQGVSGKDNGRGIHGG